MSKTFIKNTETNIEGVKIASNGTIILPSNITIDGVDLGVFKADYDVKVNQDVRSTASPTFAALKTSTINDVGNAASFTLNALNLSIIRADGSKFVATPSGSITYLDSRGINSSTAGSFEFRSVSSDNSIFNTVATLSTAGELTVTSLKTSTIKSADGTTLVDINNNGVIKITSGQDQANLTLLAGDVDNYRAARINFLNYKINTTAPIWTLISDYSQNGDNDFRLVNASNATVVSATQAGAVTIGPAGGGAIDHIITPVSGATADSRRSITFGTGGYEADALTTVGELPGDKLFLYKSGTVYEAKIGIGASSSISPFVYFQAAGSSVNGTAKAFSFYTSSMSTTLIEAMSIMSSGAVTLNSTATSGHDLLISNQDSSAAGRVLLRIGAYGNSWGLKVGSTANNSNKFELIADPGTPGNTALSAETTGAVTLGPAAGGVTHTILGSLTVDPVSTADSPSIIYNRTTTAGSTVIQIIKGTNSTATSNILQSFYINGGNTSSGAIAANGAYAATFVGFSDRRLKENIQPLNNELQKILALKPCSFDYKAGGSNIGFIAQEIEEIYPDVINHLGETEEMKTVAGWDKTAARLVCAIQELNEKFEAYKASHP